MLASPHLNPLPPGERESDGSLPSALRSLLRPKHVSNSYVNSIRRGTCDHEGRFIFDTGLRFYPDVVPGLVIDTGIVGDGSMEFSFGVGYVFGG